MDAVVSAGTEESTRQSLMAISQSIPEKVIPSTGPEGPPSNNGVEKANDIEDAQKYRSELISISYSESPFTKPLPPQFEVPAP